MDWSSTVHFCAFINGDRLTVDVFGVCRVQCVELALQFYARKGLVVSKKLNEAHIWLIVNLIRAS